MEAYGRVGYVSLFVGMVAEALPLRRVRVPSPRPASFDAGMIRYRYNQQVTPPATFMAEARGFPAENW
jgi:hypothetical protein